MQKAKRWMHTDAPAERLLDEIGLPDLEYYSAGRERGISEALRSWPLLQAVSHMLRSGGCRRRPFPGRREDEPARETDPPLRVLSWERGSAAEAGPPLEVEEEDSLDASPHKVR